MASNCTSNNVQHIRYDEYINTKIRSIFICIDKSTIDTQTSAAILSPNLVLCSGKDGHLRLFRNRYAVR